MKSNFWQVTLTLSQRKTLTQLLFQISMEHRALVPAPLLQCQINFQGPHSELPNYPDTAPAASSRPLTPCQSSLLHLLLYISTHGFLQIEHPKLPSHLLAFCRASSLWNQPSPIGPRMAKMANLANPNTFACCTRLRRASASFWVLQMKSQQSTMDLRAEIKGPLMRQLV